MKRLFVQIVVFAGLFACGGVPREKFCAEFSSAFCGVVSQCCGGYTVDQGDCRKEYTLYCHASVARPLRDGAATYDEKAAAACVTEVKALTSKCPAVDKVLNVNELAPSCALVAVGTIEEGGSCTQHPDKCADGLVCVTTTSQEESTATCLPIANEGRSCAGPEQCNVGTGLYCDTASGKCQKLPSQAGQSCQAAGVCATGLTCDPETAQCTPTLGENQSCDATPDGCAESLYCDLDGTNTCRPRGNVGAACGDATHVPCIDSAYCAAGTCQARKDVDQPCAEDEECKTFQCSAGKCGPTYCLAPYL